MGSLILEKLEWDEEKITQTWKSPSTIFNKPLNPNNVIAPHLRSKSESEIYFVIFDSVVCIFLVDKCDTSCGIK